MTGSTYRIWGTERGSWCNQEVVGVTHYLDAIARQLSRLGGRPGEPFECDVELVPEPGNPHDSRAVSVRMSAVTIGYLPREVAATWAAPLRRITGSDLTAITAGRTYLWEANEWLDGEWDARPTKVLHGRVDIKLGDPALAIPLNGPPDHPYTLLPRSGIVQVTKEAQHFAELGPLVPANGHGVLYATLHRDVLRSARTTKDIVAVHVDGRRIGELTPAMSAKFLPLVDHIAARGLLPACWADVRGSAVAAEVRIDAIKAHEASDTVLNGRPSTVPDLVPGLLVDWWTAVMTPPRERAQLLRERLRR